MKISGLLLTLLLLATAIASTIIGIGEEAPDFNLRNTDGSSVSLSQMEGSIIVLAFMDNRQPGCLILARQLEDQIWQQYNPREVKVISIMEGLTWEGLGNWERTTGATYTLLADPDGATWGDYKDSNDLLPVTYIVDRNGIVRLKETTLDLSHITTEINSLLTASIRQTTWWRIKQLFNKSN
ncbi:redoxin domain-containing protein [bacterium]|nr:redoxin domain-containing protein [bacterium]